jgi:hypothetical protein
VRACVCVLACLPAFVSLLLLSLRTAPHRNATQDLTDRYDPSKHPDVLEGRMTPSQCLADFARQWDDKNAPDGKITPAEFLEYYKDVSASIDRDDYFELMMRNGAEMIYVACRAVPCSQWPK